MGCGGGMPLAARRPPCDPLTRVPQRREGIAGASSSRIGSPCHDSYAGQSSVSPIRDGPALEASSQPAGQRSSTAVHVRAGCGAQPVWRAPQGHRQGTRPTRATPASVSHSRPPGLQEGPQGAHGGRHGAEPRACQQRAAQALLKRSRVRSAVADSLGAGVRVGDKVITGEIGALSVVATRPPAPKWRGIGTATTRPNTTLRALWRGPRF